MAVKSPYMEVGFNSKIIALVVYIYIYNIYLLVAVDDFVFFDDLLIYFDILWCFDDVLRLFLVPTWSTENVPMVYHLSTKYGGTHLVWPCLPKKNRCNVVMIIMNHDHLSSVFINYDHLWSVLICFFESFPCVLNTLGLFLRDVFQG